MRFISKLEADGIVPDKVLIAGRYALGRATDDDDIQLIVVSSSFEEMAYLDRLTLLGRLAVQIDPLIQAWGYTPGEIERHSSGEDPIMWLSMILSDARPVFPKPKRKLAQVSG
jgi:hypothetical protein